MITATTPQTVFLAYLRGKYAQSVPFGGNAAIRAHIAKVERITTAEGWEAHRANLLAMEARFAGSGTVTRLANDLAKKIRRANRR